MRSALKTAGRGWDWTGFDRGKQPSTYQKKTRNVQRCGESDVFAAHNGFGDPATGASSP